jgi:hypothetical protein
MKTSVVLPVLGVRLDANVCVLAIALIWTLVGGGAIAQGQENAAVSPLAAASAPTAVPPLVPYSGAALAADGKPLVGEAGVTFLIYKDEVGGEALWTETQTVAIDSTGHYKVQLGATNPHGLPAELFSTGEARWLEVQMAGEPAQPRVLLASVPYALKAGDATTLGGLPASAFALAGAKAPSAGVSGQGVTPDSVTDVTTTGGTTGYLPEFSGASTIVDSPVFVSGSNVGIGTTTPTQTLDVNGTTVFRSNVYVYHNGTATPSGGVNSVPMVFLTEGYNSSTKAVVAPAFQWKAEVAGNNTASPSATQNLLYSNGTTTVETGFHFNPNGTLNFAPGQTFPGTGTGNGTITGVTAGTALTGGGTSGAVTLNLDTTKVPLLAANNTFTGSQTVNGEVLATHVVGDDSAGPSPEGVTGLSASETGAGVVGVAPLVGVAGFSGSCNTTGGVFSCPLSTGFGGAFYSASGGTPLSAYTGTTSTSADLHQVFAVDSAGNGGFAGNLVVDGTLYAAAKDFKIDHPLDPKNMYLLHASVESSEMMNIYSGNVTTDELGLATVTLPAWFEAENTDFRYQLTVIGQFAQAIVKDKVANGLFRIMTNASHVEVSWQITAVRQDSYAKAHPLVVEQLKPASERAGGSEPSGVRAAGERGRPDVRASGAA